MVFNQLCPPALIYLIFSTTQVIIDSVKGLYNTALMKIWVAILFTILLNYLCTLGLGTISWLIVFIPFILMIFGFLLGNLISTNYFLTTKFNLISLITYGIIPVIFSSGIYSSQNPLKVSRSIPKSQAI